MPSVLRDFRNPQFEIRGFNAISLVCADLDETTEFYCTKLDMKVLASENAHDGSRRRLFDVGNGVDRIEFIQFAESEFAQGVATSDYLDGGMTWQPAAALVHLCLDVPLDALEAYRLRLKASSVDVTLMRSDSNFHKSFYFKDPNGINFELGAYTRPFQESDLNYSDKADFDVMARDEEVLNYE